MKFHLAGLHFSLCQKVAHLSRSVEKSSKDWKICKMQNELFLGLGAFLVFMISEFPSNLIEQCSMNTQIQMQIQTQTSLERPGKLSSAHRKKLLPVTYTGSKKILGFVGQQFVTIFEHQLLSSLITVGKRQKGQHIPVRGQVFIT